MKRYHYTECGLDNIIIEGADFLKDVDGEETICIPAINQLHRVIAEGILKREGRMTGKELRFLRTEMGMTQAQLAELLHRDVQTIARWEKSEVEMDGNADTLFRLMAAESLGIDLQADVSSISRKSVPQAGSREIIIFTDNGGYHVKAA